MKKIYVLLLTMFSFFTCAFTVEAGSFSLNPSATSVSAGSMYRVDLKYSGETLGSATINVTFQNANCSGSSSNPAIIGRCTGSSCEVTLGYSASGYTSGSTLYSLSCTSGAGTSRFSASLNNGDAWDVEGLNLVSISGASASVVVSTTTTTTHATTRTTTTSRQVITTKHSTTTKATTTRAPTTTKTPATSTTKAPTPVAPEEQEVLNPNGSVEATTQPNTEEITTTTTTEKTMESVIVPDDLKLKELKIVGYDFKFKPNMTSYKIAVAKNVNELYVIATPVDENTEITNLGIVNIENIDSFIIKVYNEHSKNSIEYKINIEREKQELKPSFDFSVLVVGLFVIIVISAVVLTIFKKGRENLESIDNVVIEPVVSSTTVVENHIEGTFIDEGIKEIPETEEELERIFDDMNNN